MLTYADFISLRRSSPRPVIALYTHFQLRDDTPSGSSRQSGGRRDWARATADAQGVADGEADDGEAEAPDPADPIYSFALITDVQYADIPDGKGALGSPRHYKYSLDIVNNAVKDWRADDSLSFGIHVGDMCGASPFVRSVPSYDPHPRVMEGLSISLCTFVYLAQR